MRSTRARVLLGLGIVAGLILLGITFWYLRSEQALKRYERKLQAHGEKLKVADWIPPHAPEGKNGVRLFRQVMMSLPNAAVNFLGTNGPHGMRMCAPGKGIVTWAQPDVREDGTNTWEEELAIFDLERPALDALEDISRQPYLDFDLDYYQGFTLLLPQLAQVKSAMLQLSYATIFDLHQGNTESAARRLHTALTLVDGMREEPLVISQLVRIAMTHIAITATWEMLQSTNVSDEILAALQNRWAALDFLAPAENALGMERGMSKKTADDMRNSSAQFRAVTTGFGGPTVSSGGAWYEKALQVTAAKSRETVWRVAFSYPDQLRAMKGDQALIESIRSVKAGESFLDAIKAQTDKLEAAGFPQTNTEDSGFGFSVMDPDIAKLFSNGVRSLERYIRRILKTVAATQLTTTAIAIKRYRIGNSALPQTLGNLVPKYLPAVPLDPADNKPLRYRVERDGSFKLYSIGEDGVDNGGDPSSKSNQSSYSWQNGSDLVWPGPATLEEAQSFLRKQAERRLRK